MTGVWSLLPDFKISIKWMQQLEHFTEFLVFILQIVMTRIIDRKARTKYWEPLKGGLIGMSFVERLSSLRV